MFLKQYNYKPRTGSQSSGSDQAATSQAATASTQTAASNANQQAANTSPAAAGRRRSSAGQFAGLQGYKRNSMDDAKKSFSEQQGQSGVLGQMWNSFTKGQEK